MTLFSPDLKQHILQQYRRHTRGAGFGALARRYHVRGGKQTVQQWYARWDGTAASLQRKPGSGHPRALTAADISRHIRAPILAANRRHEAVHYTDLLEGVRRKTGKRVSLRTIRRYGKEQLAVKDKHTKKRTHNESECCNIHVAGEEKQWLPRDAVDLNMCVSS